MYEKSVRFVIDLFAIMVKELADLSGLVSLSLGGQLGLREHGIDLCCLREHGRKRRARRMTKKAHFATKPPPSSNLVRNSRRIASTAGGALPRNPSITETLELKWQRARVNNKG